MKDLSVGSVYEAIRQLCLGEWKDERAVCEQLRRDGIPIRDGDYQAALSAMVANRMLQRNEMGLIRGRNDLDKAGFSFRPEERM